MPSAGTMIGTLPSLQLARIPFVEVLFTYKVVLTSTLIDHAEPTLLQVCPLLPMP